MYGGFPRIRLDFFRGMTARLFLIVREGVVDPAFFLGRGGFFKQEALYMKKKIFTFFQFPSGVWPIRARADMRKRGQSNSHHEKLPLPFCVL